jgi:hypothetical protein
MSEDLCGKPEMYVLRVVTALTEKPSIMHPISLILWKQSMLNELCVLRSPKIMVMDAST